MCNQCNARPCKWLKARVKANKKWRAKNAERVYFYRRAWARKKGYKTSKYYAPYPGEKVSFTGTSCALQYVWKTNVTASSSP